MRRLVRLCAVFGASAALLAGCPRPERSLLPRDGQVLLRLPNARVFQIAGAANGALFASADGDLYRAVPPRYEQWTRIASTGGFVTRLYAASPDTLFALTRECGAVFRWDEGGGWRETGALAGSGSTGVADPASCPILYDLWGRGPNDVYAVGTSGTVLHFDGRAWAREPTPLDPGQTPDVLSTTLWGVSGDAGAVYAGGAAAIRKAGDGAWELLPVPPGHPPACQFVGVAAQPGGVIFGYGYCVSEARGDSLSVRVDSIPALGTGIFAGQAQSDGTALFWTYGGEIVAVRDSAIRIRRLGGLRAVGRVVAIGSYLYVAASAGSDGVIIRVPR